MRLVSIETTPNPNSMKLNFDEAVKKATTYSREQIETAPPHIAEILSVDGIKDVFVCADFITVNRDPRSDWKLILDQVTAVLARFDNLLTVADSADVVLEQQAIAIDAKRKAGERSGGASVVVQTFRGIPIQVKVSDGQSEKRIALDKRFSDAAQGVQVASGADYLKERHWADWGIRYGPVDDVAAEIVDEIEGTLDAPALEQLAARALGDQSQSQARSLDSIKAALVSQDWHERLRAVQELPAADDNIPMLVEALSDANPHVRRMVAAALGATGSSVVVAPLCRALLEDSSIAVRRTAGDALSDLGLVDAQPAMCRALSDPNRLVRWRAARFLADAGTDEALPALTEAAADAEFEVQLEVAAALERIAGGKKGSLPMWKKILAEQGIAHE
jgi:Virulence factor/Scaffold protein Nfu/NifU N terminal/HEAT repeats